MGFFDGGGWVLWLEKGEGCGIMGKDFVFMVHN